jgi:hypothetical protein
VFEFVNQGALESRLRNSVWEFGRPGDPAPKPMLGFDRRGAITSYVNHNATLWRLSEGILEFVAASGVVTARFGAPEIGEDGRLTLKGRALGESGDAAARVLVEASEAGLPIPSRRNLVVMRAGAGGLFPDWKPAATRSWDLAISYYSEGRPDWGQEYFHAAKGPKWEPIHLWLTAHPEILEHYDYVWFPDDDLLTTWDNVDDLFQICRDYDLRLAQPALTRDSFICHEVTGQQPNCLLRFTVFVEGMCPMFRADALRLCLPVMQEPSRYGWGHDWIFPKLLGYPNNKIAIIDACPVKHTRPPGANTDRAVANAQMIEIVQKFGARCMDHRVRGRVWLEPEQGVFVP